MPGKWVGGKGSKACPEVGNVIEAMVYDDDGNTQGFVIVEVKRLYAPGEQGRFFQGDYVTASDEFYRFWVESDGGQETRVDGSYHLCKGNPPDCTAKSRSGLVTVHLGKWRTLKEEDLNVGVLPHYTGDAVGDLTRFGKRADTPATPATEGGGLPWPGKRPSGLRIGRDRPDDKKKGPGAKERDHDGEDLEEADTSTAGLRRELEKLKKRLAEKEAEDEEQLLRRKKRRVKAPGGREKEAPKEKAKGFGDLPLGKDVGIPGSPPSEHSSDESSSEDDKKSSRESERKKKGKEGKKKRDKSRSRKPSREPKRDKKEKTGKEKKSKKKKKPKAKKEKDRGPFGLSKTEEWSKEESSDSSGGDGSSESKTGFHKASGGMDHHLRLVAYASKRPGRLAVRLLRKMGQAVGFSSGANLIRSPTTEGAVPASAHLYYLAVMTPQLVSKWTPRSQRELKYWTTILDLLVQGKVAQVADVACQRVKALEKSIHDGNNWRRARFLELVEPEDVQLIDRGEERMMSKELEHEEKHRPKGSWNQWERPQKGEHKGKGKYGKGEDRDGKGGGKRKTPAEQAASKEDKGKGH